MAMTSAWWGWTCTCRGIGTVTKGSKSTLNNTDLEVNVDGCARVEKYAKSYTVSVVDMMNMDDYA